MSNRTLQARLKDLRAEGLSYAELASRLKVDRSTVSRWASGKRTPSANMRERVYSRWRRLDKRLRNAGAVVDLSGYFRRIWFDDGAPNLPLAYRRVPPYDFPPSAAVVVTSRFTIEFIDDGGFESNEGALNVTIEPNQDIGAAVQERFLEFVVKAQSPTTAGGSDLRLLKVKMEAVVLRWLK